MDTAFVDAVSHFAQNPATHGKALRELMNTDPDEFFRNSVPLLKRLQEDPGYTYVLVLLLSRGLLPSQLLREELFELEELTAIVRRLNKVDPQFGGKLLKSVMPEDDSAASDPAAVSMRLRLMDVLHAVSDGQRILPVMLRLLRDPDAKVRSKAALLAGRGNRNTRLVEECLAAGDHRVRANAVEALWDADADGVRQLLWNVLSDPDNRVVGNALLGLYRLGEAGAIEPILQMVRDSRDLFRSTAAWVMGQTGDPRFQPSVTTLIRDTAVVRATAFRALRSLNQAKARLAAAPALRMRSWRTPRPQGLEEVQITIAIESDSGPGQRVCGLSPTDFILYDDASLITNYQVREVSRAGPLSLAFLRPCYGGSEDSLNAHYVQALEAAAVHRENADRWLISRYLSKPVQNENDPPPPLPDPGFLTDAGPLSEAIHAPPADSASLPTATQTLQGVIRAAQHTKSLNIIIFIPSAPDDFSADFLAEADRAVSCLHATFHSVSAGPPIEPALQALCQATGGFCLRAATPGELPQLLDDFLLSLAGSYCVSFPAGPLALRIQVFSDQGCGSWKLS